jgi:putative DNA primase/helicase
MTAAEIAFALGGRRGSSGWTARCPAQDDRNPSLSIREASNGKIFVYCHAGCGQAHVINVLRDRGLWREYLSRSILRRAHCAPVKTVPDQDSSSRTRSALAIWQSAIFAQGTFVAAYLKSRGINPPVPEWARRLLERCGGYAGITPSREGIRILRPGDGG